MDFFEVALLIRHDGPAQPGHRHDNPLVGLIMWLGIHFIHADKFYGGKYMKESNIEQRADGLYEKSSGRKIVSPLDFCLFPGGID
ncbi:MAG: hypothetical protein KKD63_16710 [Proteobacteria bacterium]|nr:hypothetical protein [Desulfobulbaceae bacterium]MBU4154514.1 hypothetical protein [Pseudomonadota bacterium]